MRPVDLKIKVLVDAMNETGRIETIGSCEGHRSDALKSPYVHFRCDVETAAEISRTLRAVGQTGILSHVWEITGRFDHEDRLAFALRAPALWDATGRLARLWHYGLRRHLIDRDLWELAKLVKETLGAKAEGAAPC